MQTMSCLEVESVFMAINSSRLSSSPLKMLTRSVLATRYGFLANAKSSLDMLGK